MSKRYTQEQQAVMKASRNRKQLRRQYGLSFQAVEVLLKLANLRAFEKPRATQSDVARALGIDRARVCQHLRRAELVGLLVRVGRTYFFRLGAVMDAATQADIARKAAAMKRAFVRKCREIGHKSGFVAHRATHTDVSDIRDVFEPDLTRQQALAELKTLYVPLHERQALR